MSAFRKPAYCWSYGDISKDFVLLFSLRHSRQGWPRISFSRTVALETPHIYLHQTIPK